MSSAAWYALHVRSCCEQIVDDTLARAGVQHYWPNRLHKATQRGREYLVRRPIFDGYVFGRFVLEERRPVIEIPQVIRIVGFGNHAVAIPDHEIESVRIMAESPVVIRRATPIDLLLAGDPVRIKSGPLRGVEGTVVWSETGKPRVIVGITILGGYRSVEVDRSWLEVRKAA